MHRIFLVAVAAAALGCGGGDGEPNPTKSHALPAPEADVHLRRDDLGVTHVLAQNDADAFFGAGYAQARDRLFEMELNRRQAFGTTAELLGVAQLQSDIQSRTLNFRALGAADLARVKKEAPADVALVEAWIAGVNRRIGEIAAGDAPRPYGLGPTELDYVPEPWTAADAFAVGKILAFGLSDTLEDDALATLLLNLVTNAATEYPFIMPAFDVFTTKGATTAQAPAAAPLQFGPMPALPAGLELPSQRMFPRLASNNWAVAGAHTANGKPYLAGDPHQPLTSPTRFWPHHMSSVGGGGTLDVVGFAFPGTPSVELGHNAHVGWTATTNFADVIDIWAVDVADGAIQLGGEKRRLSRRVERIKVKKDGGRVGTGDEFSVQIDDCPGFGVVLPSEFLGDIGTAVGGGKSVLLQWTGFEPTTELEVYIALDRAKDLDAFEAAVDHLEVGAVNFVAASAKGIDYHVHALVPDRGDPSTHEMPWHVLAADDAESLWTRGFLPPSKLPHVRDPSRGYIVTANNDPFGFTADNDVSNDPYYYGTFFDKGFRAHRITSELERLIAEKPGRIERADMEALQQDTHSPMADILLPLLADATAAIGTDPNLAEFEGRTDLATLNDRLQSWDRRFDKTEGTPVVFLALEWYATQRTLRGPLTPLLFDQVTPQEPPFMLGIFASIASGRLPASSPLLPAGGTRELMLSALSDASAWITKRFGALDATFLLADVHAAEFPSTYGHELDVPLTLVSGSSDTVNVSQAAFFSGDDPLDHFRSHDGSLYRMVVGFGADDVPEATIDFARGANENPGDPHFGDQQALWADAGHLPLPFRPTEVAAHATDDVLIRAK